MRTAASAGWYAFIKRFEGEVSYMYVDTKGLVTVGIGNLIDPMSLASALPFQFKPRNRKSAPPGRLATRAEIETEWKNLKNSPKRNLFMTMGYRLTEPETDLELSSANLRRIFDDKTANNERQLRTFFADFDQWPADAQIALMAMAWGLGPGFPNTWPSFTAACRKQDFDAAAKAAHISSWRAERNDASVRLFGNAARVVTNPKSYSRDVLYYPRVLLDEVNVGA